MRGGLQTFGSQTTGFTVSNNTTESMVAIFAMHRNCRHCMQENFVASINYVPFMCMLLGNVGNSTEAF